MALKQTRMHDIKKINEKKQKKSKKVLTCFNQYGIIRMYTNTGKNKIYF